MGAIRKSITFTEKQDLWIRFKIESGDFTSDSEYIRHLIREDQSRTNLREALDYGVQSGVSDKSILDIISDKKKMRNKSDV